MSRRSVATALTVSALLCGAAVADVTASAPAPDSFYAGLLRDGELLADQGKSVAAVKSLRIACFGMLDQPVVLARCLVRLGLAQAATGDGGAFRETFSRLLEVESRQPAYSAADIAPPIRSAFEQQVAQRIPSATLAASPTFQKLATEGGDGKNAKHGRKESPAVVKTPPAPAPEAQPAPQPKPVPPPTPAPHAEPLRTSAPAVPPPPAAAAPVQNPVGQKPASVAPPAASTSTPAARPAPAMAPPPPAPASPPALASAAAPTVLSAEEQAAIASARTRMQGAKVAADLLAAADTAKKVADAHPASVEANALAGEIFYRSSRWPAAVIYLERSGPPAGQPLLAFYLAVAQFESGDRAGAASTLRPLLGKLQHTPYVQTYIQKILPP